MSQHAILNHRKDNLNKLFDEISNHSSIDDVRRSALKIKEVVEQICGRAEVAESRIQELEEWVPLTIDIKCPHCNTETQVSVPGSSWYKQELEKIKNG